MCTGGLDGRGKKKKAIPNNDLKLMLEQIEAGAMDQVDPFPIPEPFWPSQSQALKLNKAIVERNKELDFERAKEVAERNRIMEQFKVEMDRWAVQETKRKVELEKVKKMARLVNLKFDLAMDRFSRAQQDCDESEEFLRLIKDLQRLHEHSKDRFKMMRMKHYMEFTRQQEYIGNIKKRLLFAVRARRYALDLPGSATNEVQLAQFTAQAEEALRVLKVEIFDCKEMLVHEGIRLRTLFR